MTVGPNLIVLRLSIFSAMTAATVTLLYLAPVPDQVFKSCDRPCHELDWPMICRFKLTIEKLPTSVICQECLNSTDCTFCSTQADLSKHITIANRQLPAPSFHVCHNDIIIIDVHNKIQNEALTLHWRGQSNIETPFMDGVPLITQCPIGPYTTFQYQFRASSAGTHLYHAFSDSDRSNGLYGALVVRKSEKIESNFDNYDTDDKAHLIVLSESRKNILINGVGPGSSNLTTFSLNKGVRALFRVIHASGSGCPLTLSIDKHMISVIAVDGNPTIPLEVSSVKLNKGETFDAVLEANQDHETYFITARSNCESKKLVGKAVLSYRSSSERSSPKIFDFVEGLKKLDTGPCDQTKGKLCLGNIRLITGMEGNLRHLNVDKRIYLGFHKKKLNGVAQNIAPNSHRMNNISFVFPASPVLTQPEDVPIDLLCKESYSPDRCKGKEECECLHLEHIPLGSSTELILIDQGGEDIENIFYLHGHQFYVVGHRVLENPLPKSEVERLDADLNFIHRNLENPVKKTTIRVPKNGIVAIRFIANNPGFWLLRDENSHGWTRGMDIIFQIGDTGDIVPPPSDFPVCGNYIGPEFFLL